MLYKKTVYWAALLVSVRLLRQTISQAGTEVMESISSDYVHHNVTVVPTVCFVLRESLAYPTYIWRKSYDFLNTLPINLLSGLEIREYGRSDPLRWPRDTVYPQKLALT
jgi:hypothetical protein